MKYLTKNQNGVWFVRHEPGRGKKYLTKNQNGVWFVRHEPGRGDFIKEELPNEIFDKKSERSVVRETRTRAWVKTSCKNPYQEFKNYYSLKSPIL